MSEAGMAQGKLDRFQILRSLYLHMVEGVALYELVQDVGGKPVNYRILDANPQFRRFVGIEDGQIAGMLATDVFGAKAAPFLDELAAVALGGQPSRFESYFEAIDRHYDVSAVPLGQGQFATIFLDISERRRSEQALREGQWFLERAQHVAQMGSFRLGIATGIWNNSTALNQIFGIGDAYRRDAEGWLALVHPADRDSVQQLLGELRRGEATEVDRHYRIVRPNDNAVRWVHCVGELEKETGARPLFVTGIVQDVTDSMLREQALRASEERFRRILETIPTAVTLADADGTILFCNDTFCMTTGLRREAILGEKTSSFMVWVEEHERDRMYADLKNGHTVDAREFKMRRRDGQLRVMQISSRIVELDGQPRVLSSARDVTDLRNLEQQMLHSQKLESLGVLAGGIAHDFNNLLTGILGNADLAKTEMSPLAPSRASLEGIEVAARRAADLCRQLLAYSGRGRFIIQPLNLQELVEEMGHLLSVSISKKVVLKYHFSVGVPAVEADATQLRQVIMNLIVNASEAIGERSGVISVSIGLSHCDERYLKSCFGADDIRPGDYVYVEVADTGRGMDRATMDRIFDPFFSTKFTGRGLGLAAVLGIVRGHHGAIKVYSEEGRGTTFKLLFPASESLAHKLEPKMPVTSGYHSSGKILLADDEETIRNLGRRMLQRAGFVVELASDGREAISKFAMAKDEIRLVILDLTMPHSDGEVCYREMRQIKPGVKVILSSGYNEQDIVNRFAGKGLSGFVQKPYTSEELLSKVREALAE